MANKAKYANLVNHRRQLAYLRVGVVMLPKLDKVFRSLNRRK